MDDPTTTTSRVAAYTLAAVAAVMALLGAGLFRDRGLPWSTWAHSNLAGAAVLALGMAGCGALVVRARPRNTLGWLFLAEAELQGATVLATEWATRRIGSGDPDAVAVLAAWVGANAWWPGLLLLAFVPLLFPDGRLGSRRWRPVAWLASLAAVVGVVVGVGSGALVAEAFPTLPVTAPLEGLPEPVVAGTAGVALLTVVGCAVLAMGGLVLRLRRAAARERGQLGWFLVGCLALVCLSVLPWQPWAGLVGNVLFPVALGVAILRHQLYSGDRLLSRTLVYGLLTAGVLVVLGLGAGLLGAGVAGASGAVVLAALAVAVGLEPLRQAVQRAVDHALFGGPRDPYLAMRRAAVELSSAGDDPLCAVTRTVAASLGALRADVVPTTAAVPASGFVDSPLVVGSECVGVLRVQLQPGRTRFDPADEVLLAGLVPQVAAAVRTTALLREAEVARTELLLAVEDERRRLRHDLHDGVGPTLAGLSLGLSAVAVTSQSGEVAPGVLDRLARQAESCVREVHVVVEGLRPSALDSMGLVGALREHAASLTSPRGDFAVHVEACSVPPLPAAVELAAYRCAMEAMTNAAVHARASDCQVVVAVVGPELCVEVCDDGVGLAATRRSVGGAGVGLRSLDRRAAELGGRSVVDSGPHGTRVRVMLPTGGL